MIFPSEFLSNTLKNINSNSQLVKLINIPSWRREDSIEWLVHIHNHWNHFHIIYLSVSISIISIEQSSCHSLNLIVLYTLAPSKSVNPKLTGFDSPPVTWVLTTDSYVFVLYIIMNFLIYFFYYCKDIQIFIYKYHFSLGSYPNGLKEALLIFNYFLLLFIPKPTLAKNL